MTIRYHVTVDRQGEEWRAVCPALRHGTVARLGVRRRSGISALVL